jgi:hypothetical protein
MNTTVPTHDSDDPVIVDEELIDEELTALALAADPDGALDPDAVPFRPGDDAGGLLPGWYMPAPVRSSRSPWHRALAIAAVAGFVAINAFGLCITYGFLVVA